MLSYLSSVFFSSDLDVFPALSDLSLTILYINIINAIAMMTPANANIATIIATAIQTPDVPFSDSLSSDEFLVFDFQAEVAHGGDAAGIFLVDVFE